MFTVEELVRRRGTRLVVDRSMIPIRTHSERRHGSVRAGSLRRAARATFSYPGANASIASVEGEQEIRGVTVLAVECLDRLAQRELGAVHHVIARHVQVHRCIRRLEVIDV